MNIYKHFNKPIQLPGYSKRNIIVPQLAYNNALKQGHQFLDAEPFIKQNPEYALYYARDVIKHRWPEAEQYIKQTPYYWTQYKH